MYPAGPSTSTYLLNTALGLEAVVLEASHYRAKQSMCYQRRNSLIISWGCKYLCLNGWGRLRFEDSKLLLKVIPEAKLNPAASRSSFAFSECDIAQHRRGCSTCCMALARSCQGTYCSTSPRLHGSLPLPLQQALQCCSFPALLPTLKFQFAGRGKVKPKTTDFRSMPASSFLPGNTQTSAIYHRTLGTDCSIPPLVQDIKAPTRGCFWGNA